MSLIGRKASIFFYRIANLRQQYGGTVSATMGRRNNPAAFSRTHDKRHARNRGDRFICISKGRRNPIRHPFPPLCVIVHKHSLHATDNGAAMASLEHNEQRGICRLINDQRPRNIDVTGDVRS